MEYIQTRPFARNYRKRHTLQGTEFGIKVARPRGSPENSRSPRPVRYRIIIDSKDRSPTVSQRHSPSTQSGPARKGSEARERSGGQGEKRESGSRKGFPRKRRDPSRISSRATPLAGVSGAAFPFLRSWSTRRRGKSKLEERTERKKRWRRRRRGRRGWRARKGKLRGTKRERMARASTRGWPRPNRRVVRTRGLLNFPRYEFLIFLYFTTDH